MLSELWMPKNKQYCEGGSLIPPCGGALEGIVVIQDGAVGDNQTSCWIVFQMPLLQTVRDVLKAIQALLEGHDYVVGCRSTGNDCRAQLRDVEDLIEVVDVDQVDAITE